MSSQEKMEELIWWTSSGHIITRTMKERFSVSGLRLCCKTTNTTNTHLGSGGVSILDPYFNSTSVARIGTAAGKSHKLYVFDLANLGGYRQGLDETDSVLQTIPIGGDVYGGVGSYP